jgi:MATE family multidrug resistance protein
MWSFTALALDAYAATVQSLVGYFIGQNSITQVKKVVRVALSWNLGTGFLLGGLMWWGQNLVINILVPAASISVFLSAWGVFAISLPINSLAFLTDGVHWGTGDFQYLRNAMLFSSAVGISGLWLVETGGYGTLFWVWVLIGIWITFRALFGMIRIWPGIGKSVFRTPN